MPSSKVLVTNLHNLTQPLIRYELTDRFTQAAPAEGGWLRVGVDGRADDLFRYAAASVHPFVIGAVLARAPAVREFQVRQTDRGRRRRRPGLRRAVHRRRAQPAPGQPATSAGHHPLGRRAGPRRPNREGQALHPAGHLPAVTAGRAARIPSADAARGVGVRRGDGAAYFPARAGAAAAAAQTASPASHGAAGHPRGRDTRHHKWTYGAAPERPRLTFPRAPDSAGRMWISASGPASPVLRWYGRRVGGLGPGLTSYSADAI